MNQQQYDKVIVNIYDTRKEMGEAAAREASQCINKLLGEKAEINCMFAAAPSQNEFLTALVKDKSIPWQRINAFHMDEYVGLKEEDLKKKQETIATLEIGQIRKGIVKNIRGN